jgi:pimeloyl-ACP methyl ester carboxylesterase
MKRWMSRGLKAGVFGCVLLLTLPGVLWLEHSRPLELPVPTGPFAVGRLMTAWADQGQIDPLTRQKRELMVWIWYPAATGPPAEVREKNYLPAPLRTEVQRARGTLISSFLTRDLSKIQAHSKQNSDMSPRQLSYPVVVMRAGSSAEVWNYSTLAEDLASHGYVVVGFDAPYRTSVVVFPDGRVIRRMPENNPELCLGRPDQEHCADRLLMAWTTDTAFVLDRLKQLNESEASGKFTGRLDLTRVGVFGHSFGGAAALQFCSQDSRCKAGIDVDGAPHGSVIQAGIHKPFLFLLSDHSRESDPDSRQILADIQSIYDRLPPEGKLRLAIRGANHFLFSDDGALLKSHIVLRMLRLLGILGIDGRRQLAVTTYCVYRFFDTYLKRESVPPLKISSPLYPEIQLVP